MQVVAVTRMLVGVHYCNAQVEPRSQMQVVAQLLAVVVGLRFQLSVEQDIAASHSHGYVAQTLVEVLHRSWLL